jgi:hypothetical protein
VVRSSAASDVYKRQVNLFGLLKHSAASIPAVTFSSMIGRS